MDVTPIFEKWHLDKVLNGYQKVYNDVFKNSKKAKNILEIGIGTTDPTLVSSMSYWSDGDYQDGHKYKTGNSLRAWRDLCKDANIWGVDVDCNAMFEENKIKTFCSSSMDYPGMKKILDTIDEKFDIIIDDGLHTAEANLITLDILFPYLKKGGTYVIEDINQGIDDNAFDTILADYRFKRATENVKSVAVYDGFAYQFTRVITITK